VLKAKEQIKQALYAKETARTQKIRARLQQKCAHKIYIVA
jgi:hypothetical protein